MMTVILQADFSLKGRAENVHMRLRTRGAETQLVFGSLLPLLIIASYNKFWRN